MIIASKAQARGVQNVARVHFPADVQGEGHDEPGESLPYPGAHLVDEEQYFCMVVNLRR